MKGKRSNILMPTEDIPLLQEMAYIKHKKDIVAYLEDVKRQELQDFKNLKVSCIEVILFFGKNNDITSTV